ncbi:uncharacterized protein LOC128555823 [Mercenaria mercenaria]|uniref:uncharacterized protein LOC128555823 n=1 Tax=Mercenaria mercenaria TaxID=6596 RepID=UPI00234E3F09|nr:uncharacterized protein LOC128555823 [Mercenaria mercenaria]
MVHSTTAGSYTLQQPGIGLFTLRSEENVTYFGCALRNQEGKCFLLFMKATQLVKGQTTCEHGASLPVLVFHFDNAASQNRNNILLWYGLWRALLGYHRSIEYSAMITDHAKFESDLHF